jgi:hypothetical protein
MGHRMRAGCSTIAGGPLTPQALRAWSPHPQPGPHGGSHFAPDRQGARTEYSSDSDATPDRAPDSNPLSEFYSNPDYEFEFGLDP